MDAMKFTTKKIPKKITPCPINEAIFELRFESNLSAEIIPGILFNELNSEFPTIERLPILEMPQVIRDSNPNLKYSPHHVFQSEEYRFQVGPNAFSLICPKEYVGWGNFKEKIEFILEAVKAVSLIKQPVRTGLRYINLFENKNIFESLKIDLSIDGNPLIDHQNYIRSEFDYSGYKCLLSISNQSKTADADQASVVDIDIIKKISNEGDINYPDIITKSHTTEKEIFFSLLKEEYLETFNPEYED